MFLIKCQIFSYNVRYHMTDGPRMTSRRSFNSSVSDNPTFPEFVDYLIRTPPNLMDKHWAPYTKVEFYKSSLIFVYNINPRFAFRATLAMMLF